MKLRLALVIGILAGGLCSAASAAALSGTFNMTGTITVTNTAINWQSDLAPFTADRFTLSGGTGSFALENGQNQINDLTLATEPVGVTINPEQVFISFLVSPLAQTLNLNFIASGLYTSANCGSNTVGATCTLPGSPFSFVNSPGGGSTASFIFSGITSDHLSTWVGTFTTHFNQPFGTVLAPFLAGTGSPSITNTYSATSIITVTPTVPEPGTMAFLGTGLVLLTAAFRKYRRML